MVSGAGRLSRGRDDAESRRGIDRMASYILRRLIQAIPIIIGISLISFLIVHLTPGSPVDKFRTPRVSPDTINNLIRLYGLNESLPVQFGKWFSKFWTFPFDNTAWGYSFTDGLPVRDKIFARIPSTLWLTGMSLLVTVMLAIPIGILQAVRQYSWSDKIITTFETIGYALPTFWPVSYTHLRAHETRHDLVCRLLLE